MNNFTDQISIIMTLSALYGVYTISKNRNNKALCAICAVFLAISVCLWILKLCTDVNFSIL